MSSPDSIVVANGLTKVFKDFWQRPKVTAVNGIDFEIKRGRIFGLLGPNGSGKSTTIKMLLGLLHPTAGELTVFGQDTSNVANKSRVGYLPEESYLYPHLSAPETLDFYGRLFDLDRATRKLRTAQLLDMVGLNDIGHRTLGEFSKGMARRVGLAQALINDPELIILDEPTSGLDPLGTRQVKDLIIALARRGKTILLSSHLLSDVEDVCDEIVILFNGKVCARGLVDDLLKEQSQVRFTVPNLSPKQVQDALARLRDICADDPVVDHPQRNLEQFFLSAVRDAQQTGVTQTGARASEHLADFLSTESDT